MNYWFKPSALTDLRHLPKIVQKQIIHKLNFYTESSYPLKFAKRLKDPSLGEFRYRVGDFRIIFDLDGDKIIILAVGHRKDIYK